MSNIKKILNTFI